MMDIEEIIPGADVARRRREQWEAEHLSALAERRAKKQPITERDVELHYERLLVAAAPLVNARAAEVRARQERIKTRQPRSITPPPLAPRTVEPLAPPRKKAVRSKGKARGYGDDPPPVRDGSARAELRPVMARLSTATLRELIGALEAEEGR